MLGPSQSVVKRWAQLGFAPWWPTLILRVWCWLNRRGQGIKLCEVGCVEREGRGWGEETNRLQRSDEGRLIYTELADAIRVGKSGINRERASSSE